MKRLEAAHFQRELPKTQSQQQYYDTATSKEQSFKEFYLFKAITYKPRYIVDIGKFNYIELNAAIYIKLCA